MDAKTLKEHIERSKKLQYVFFMNAQDITEIPPEINLLNSVRHFTFSNSKVKQLPTEFWELHSLIQLNLSHNPIEFISDEIGNLEKLTRLDLSNTKLKDYRFLLKIPQLKTLKMSACGLKTIPAELFKLPQLYSLDLSHNNIETLPEELTQLPSLERLNLSHNPLQHFAVSANEKLTFLVLGYCKITQLAENIGELRSLKHLYLNNNLIKQLPKSIGKLTELKRLSIKDNPLSEFPTEIESLDKLENLNFNPIWMNDFPYTLLKLTAINELPGGKIVNKRATYIARLAREVNKKEFSWELATFLMDLLAERQQKIIQHPKYTELLMRATGSRLHLIHQTIQQIISQQYNKAKKKRLGTHAVVAAVGKTSFNLNQLRKRMKKLSIQYSSKITAEVTHLLLGKSPRRKIEQALQHEEHFIFITEKILLDYLNEVDTPYLLEEEENNAEQLAALLLSQQEENIELALQILGKGGVPSELITELTIVYFAGFSQQIKKKTRRLLEQYGPKGLAPYFSTSNSMLRGFIQGYYTHRTDNKKLDDLLKGLSLDKQTILDYLKAKETND